jgi:hypothetical protein
LESDLNNSQIFFNNASTAGFDNTCNMALIYRLITKINHILSRIGAAHCVVASATAHCAGKSKGKYLWGKSLEQSREKATKVSTISYWLTRAWTMTQSWPFVIEILKTSFSAHFQQFDQICS